MKRLVLFAVVLTLTAGLAWAEPPTAEPAAQPLFAAEGDGCQMPDISGLDEDETLAAMLESGFEVAPANTAAAACPATFNCNSITNCAKGSNCSVTTIGQCCTVGGGLGFCCIPGPIKVERCRCRCTAFLCALACVNSTNVRLFC